MTEFIHVDSEDSLKKFNKHCKGKILFVKYYMVGCGHCEDLEPVWKLIESKLKKEKEKKDVLVTQLNADYMNNADIPNVEGFPTISIIKGGKKIDHDGSRTENDILNFYKKHTSNTLQSGGSRGGKKSGSDNNIGREVNIDGNPDGYNRGIIVGDNGDGTYEVEMKYPNDEGILTVATSNIHFSGGRKRRKRKTKNKRNKKSKKNRRTKKKTKRKRSKKGKGPVMSRARGLLPVKKVAPKTATTAIAEISNDNYTEAKLNRRGHELMNEIRNPRSPWTQAAAEQEFNQNKRLFERKFKNIPVAEPVEEEPKIVGRKKRTSIYDGATKSGFTVEHGRRINRIVPMQGGKRKKRVTKKNKKGGKWSRKYKKSINCRRPKGFSQKQYCKFGRNKRGGRADPGYSAMSEQQLLDLIRNQNNPYNLGTLKDIVQAKNTFDTTGEEIVGTTKTGFMALKKINKILNELLDRHAYTNEEWTDELNEDHAKYAWFQDEADAIISDSSPEDPIEGVIYNNTEGEPLYGLDFHEQFNDNNTNIQGGKRRKK